MKRIECQVEGMTCSSCEVLIERKLNKLPGVNMVSADIKSKKVLIECDENVEFSDLQEAVKEKGYTLHELVEEDHLQKRNGKFFSMPNGKIHEITATLFILAVVYILFTQLNIFPDNIGIKEGMGLGFVFLIGLVASTSTCLAVSGGLLLAIAQKYNDNNKDKNLTGIQKFKPHIAFNIGRVFFYALLGGLVGLIGSAIAITGTITALLTVVASLLMIVLGLQLLGIFPWLSNVQLKMPKFIAHRLYQSSEKKSSSSMLSSFLFGGATFFLPCGFTQALQIYVLGTGSFTTGALTMFAFSLGTLPTLAGIGTFTSFVKTGKLQKYFMTFSAVLVIILGVFTLPNGVAPILSNFDSGSGAINLGSTDNVDSNTELQNVEIVDGFQIVNMDVIKYDYYPHQFTIYKDMPVKWQIDGREAAGCGRVITAPELGVTELLSNQGITTIEFTPTELGDIEFSCTMWMMTPGSKFTVIENPNI